MFEAMACGIPVVSAPWDDVENIFVPGTYIRVASGEQMKAALNMLVRDSEFAAAIADAGFADVVAHHTCRHRVVELLHIADSIHASRHTPVHPLCKEPAS